MDKKRHNRRNAVDDIKSPEAALKGLHHHSFFHCFFCSVYAAGPHKKKHSQTRAPAQRNIRINLHTTKNQVQKLTLDAHWASAPARWYRSCCSWYQNIPQRLKGLPNGNCFFFFFMLLFIGIPASHTNQIVKKSQQYFKTCIIVKQKWAHPPHKKN